MASFTELNDGQMAEIIGKSVGKTRVVQIAVQ
jgi:hypothetical protein